MSNPDPNDSNSGGGSDRSDPDTNPDSAEPVCHDPLDGDFSDRVNDISGDPTPSGLRFVDDRRGSVLELDGGSADDEQGYYTLSYHEINDYVSRGEPMTIDLWVKPVDDRGWERAIGVGPAIDIRDGNLRFRRYDPNENRNEFVIRKDVDTYVPNAEWTHLIGTVKRGREARPYVDGSRVESAATDDLSGTLGGFVFPGDTGSVGHVHSENDVANGAHFGGRVDDARVYRRTMEDRDAPQLYEAARVTRQSRLTQGQVTR